MNRPGRDRAHEHLAAVSIFVAVADAKSFSSAARTMGITKSAVSKQIAKLESSLGLKLLKRTTRSVGLTEAGQAYYDRASQALALIREADGAVAELVEQPRGLLRVTAPVTWGRRRLSPLVPEFLATYPGVELQLVLLDRAVDLIHEGYDLAIRLARRLPPGLIARRLAPVEYRLCGAPGLFQVEAPSDLAQVECLRFGENEGSSPWHFLSASGGRHSVQVRGRYLVNSSEALREAVLKGLGPALLPDYIVEADLAMGTLEHLLPEWEAQAPFASQPWLVWMPERHIRPSMRAFIDFVQRRLGAGKNRI